MGANLHTNCLTLVRRYTAATIDRQQRCDSPSNSQLGTKKYQSKCREEFDDTHATTRGGVVMAARREADLHTNCPPSASRRSLTTINHQQRRGSPSNSQLSTGKYQPESHKKFDDTPATTRGGVVVTARREGKSPYKLPAAEPSCLCNHHQPQPPTTNAANQPQILTRGPRHIEQMALRFSGTRRRGRELPCC